VSVCVLFFCCVGGGVDNYIPVATGTPYVLRIESLIK